MKMHGFSLIEIMITSFILALGLLGLAGMQSTAVKSNIEIQQRTLANALITDINERMQLNRVWLQEDGNDYAIASLMGAELSAPSCVGYDGVFTNCSGADIKNNDLYEWKQKFLGAEIDSGSTTEHGLIDADACIEVTEEGNIVVSQIVLSWYSTIKSKDAASGSDVLSIFNKCGTASSSRRQLTAKSKISKSS
ncbi:type IV pilus modification protein PilV [Psychromonas ossibalaenae]|uniref:type IV pilus modification protein PilV n=1 Tax=Psychromonas ossibalaenae TaxID=444922 RepID=UPI0003738DD1|nr:type IV pilus modification protein PilV [Psychromonas ossibalaenae]